MKSDTFEAVTYEGEVYCIECIPEIDLDLDIDSEGVHPIFAGEEWDYAPSCNVCGETHSYMQLLYDNWDDYETDEERDDFTADDLSSDQDLDYTSIRPAINGDMEDDETFV